MLKCTARNYFKKLIDLEMEGTELMNKVNISTSTFHKIKNG